MSGRLLAGGRGESCIGGASVGPVDVLGGYEWSTAESNPIGNVNFSLGAGGL
jgi:hypothetical protein